MSLHSHPRWSNACLDDVVWVRMANHSHLSVFISRSTVYSVWSVPNISGSKAATSSFRMKYSIEIFIKPNLWWWVEWRHAKGGIGVPEYRRCCHHVDNTLIWKMMRENYFRLMKSRYLNRVRNLWCSESGIWRKNSKKNKRLAVPEQRQGKLLVRKKSFNASH